jgi:hypothetical protein
MLRSVMGRKGRGGRGRRSSSRSVLSITIDSLALQEGPAQQCQIRPAQQIPHTMSTFRFLVSSDNDEMSPSKG